MYKLLLKTLLLTFVLNTSLLARDININTVVDTLKGTDKHLLVFLHKTDCGYCDSMIMFTLDDDLVKPLLEKEFAYIHINISEKDEVHYKDFKGSGREFAKLIGYNLYPTSVFIDTNNEIVFIAPGKREEGPFLNILNYIISKSYKKMDLESYENMIDFKK